MSMPMALLISLPLNTIGAVHEACTVTSPRRVLMTENTLTATAVLNENIERSDKNDILLSIVITVKSNKDEVVQTIENRYRILNPNRGKVQGTKGTDPPVVIDYKNDANWKEVFESSFPMNTGRKYAAVNGDINPIHMYPITAKAFGYKSCIAHGMYSVCRVLAKVESESTKEEEEVTFSGKFVRPMFLPNKAVVSYRNDKSGDYVVGYYAVDSKKGGEEVFKVCVEGNIKNSV
jgi:hypothetical protein